MLFLRIECSFQQDIQVAQRLHNLWDIDFKAYKTQRLIVSDFCFHNDLIIAATLMEISTDSVRDCLASLKEISEITVKKYLEITVEEYKQLLVKSYGNNFLQKTADSALREMNACILPNNHAYQRPCYTLYEHIYSPVKTKKAAMGKLNEILAAKSLKEEIDRIYSTKNRRKFYGHPVHYLISTGSKDSAKDIVGLLVPALLKNKRLISGRVCFVSELQKDCHSEEEFADIFYSSQGGAVVIDLALENDGMYASAIHLIAEKLGQLLKKYGSKTLFIFIDSENSTIKSETLSTILSNADMIHITEGQGDIVQAELYLKKLAAKTSYDYSVAELTQYLPPDKTLYTVTEIYEAYNRWQGNGLKTHVYKAYKNNHTFKIEPQKKVAKPYEELQNMIGLTEVKRVTDEILATTKMQNIRKEMGLVAVDTSMHMMFSGAPGTAKTTVARLLAQILKEEESLTNGHIVECGRQDLVARYVGWTARAVEEKFRAARGGILFIDEAYSLVEDGRNYGAEAINTIVHLMENYRSELIVIFAGYPEKMKSFLEQNEGLASRIAFHLDFPDYAPDELLEILKLMLQKRGYVTNDLALKKCYEIFSEACKNENFGNGRFVRNLLEHAAMRQANRLLRDNITLTKEAVELLVAEDFEMLGTENKNEKKIGF